MNRRGDAATFALIAVTVLLVIVALFSFRTFNVDVRNSSAEVAEVVRKVHFSEVYVQALAKSVAEEVLASGTNANALKGEYQKKVAARDLQIDEAGNFFGKIRTGDFVFEERGGTIALEVRGLFVRASSGLNSMKREFEIVKVFEKVKKEETLA